MMAERCIACHLTLYKTKTINMIFVLRTATLDCAVSTLRSPCSAFGAIEKETCIRKEIVSVLLKMTIVCTWVHQRIWVVNWCSRHIVHRLSESLRLLLGCWLGRAVGWSKASDKLGTTTTTYCSLIWWCWSLFVGRYGTCICLRLTLGRICPERKETSSWKLEAVFKILRNGVMVAAELRDIEEVVRKWILLCEVRAVANFTAIVVV